MSIFCDVCKKPNEGHQWMSYDEVCFFAEREGFTLDVGVDKLICNIDVGNLIQEMTAVDVDQTRRNEKRFYYVYVSSETEPPEDPVDLEYMKKISS